MFIVACAVACALACATCEDYSDLYNYDARSECAKLITGQAGSSGAAGEGGEGETIPPECLDQLPHDAGASDLFSATK